MTEEKAAMQDVQNLFEQWCELISVREISSNDELVKAIEDLEEALFGGGKSI